MSPRTDRAPARSAALPILGVTLPAAQPSDLPPWFTAFDLASNTRFTRTPDHALRRRAPDAASAEPSCGDEPEDLPHGETFAAEEAAPIATAPVYTRVRSTAAVPARPTVTRPSTAIVPAPVVPDRAGPGRVVPNRVLPALDEADEPEWDDEEEAVDEAFPDDDDEQGEDDGADHDLVAFLASLPPSPQVPFLGYRDVVVEATSTWHPLVRARRTFRPLPPVAEAFEPEVEGVELERSEPVRRPAPSRSVPAALDPDWEYELPPIELLSEPTLSEPSYEASAEYLDRSSVTLQQTLHDFGVRGEIIDANPGPVVTLYELEPAPGTKSSRVIGLSNDIARSMSAVSARVAVVPGRNVIGIELPNGARETVYLRELLETPDFSNSKHRLAVALGKTIGGAPVIVDLARMPHLLVAGTTGSGKSVAINTMILSLLYTHRPADCRLIMVDPKMLELSVYEGIPHLLTPVVTDPKKAVVALKWAVREMEERYRAMSRLGVRSIDGYNARLAEMAERGELPEADETEPNGSALPVRLPYIVVIVDEMADLMMVAGKDIEGAIQRLAQMARAAGIHLIMATQRPSVDVITGTIKANFPTRISFQVTSKIDSRTILGEMGAEQLLGQGDMLYMAGGGRITRVHGPFVSDAEVEHVVAHLKAQGRPEYIEAVTVDDEAGPLGGTDEASAEGDPIEPSDDDDPYDQAVAVVMRDRKASTSYIQRRLGIGYNRAASIMERMEKEGLVGPANHAGKRAIHRDEAR